LAIFTAIRRAQSSVSSFAVNRYSFEVKVYADNAARALRNSAKNLLVTGRRERMPTTEITQVMALSACVSAFISLLVLAAFR
jgi:hypothetical protein